MARVCLVVLALSCALAGASTELLQNNPIRKVVTMLQDMQKQVEAEGAAEKELFDKFMCYCGNGAGKLEASIQTASAAIESLTGKVETEKAQKSQAEQDVAQHKTDRSEAQKTIQESTAMRNKEAAEFAASSGEMKANVDAMGGALAALRKGLSASLLQTSVGQTLRNIIQHSPAVSEMERSSLLSFLESGEGGATDQIIGIVDQMKDEMTADLKESTAGEAEAKSAFETLVASKESEIDAAGKAVEAKTGRVGELAVSIVQAEADLKDTSEALDEDTKMKANLAASCATKQEEWDARSKLRAEEVTAISETIEMLNSDDALELFKKTLPSGTSLLQVRTSLRTQEKRASAILQKLMALHTKHSTNLRMMLLAMKSGGGFDKVVEMIDGMIANLDAEQADDDKKKDFCIAELDKTADEKKAQDGELSDISADIAEKEDSLEVLKSEIAALQKGVADLDTSVAQATEQRKEEHAEYASTAASNQAVLELIGMAKNRLNKFYAPSQYKAPPTTTESSSPYGFVQVSSHAGRADGVIGMMDQMIKDVEMDIADGKHDEEDAQKDYEEAMEDAATKRSEDSKLIVEKDSAKADLLTRLQTAREARATKREQLGITEDKLDALHKDCDYLLQNYDERKATRATEHDGLNESKHVLAGAK